MLHKASMAAQRVQGSALPGVPGVSPGFTYSPFLARKGDKGGWSKR